MPSQRVFSGKRESQGGWGGGYFSLFYSVDKTWYEQIISSVQDGNLGFNKSPGFPNPNFAASAGQKVRISLARGRI